MNFIKKKNGKKDSNNVDDIDINKLITIDKYFFLIDKFSFHGNDIKLHIYTNGDLFLLYGDDIEELFGSMIEYIGIHNYDLWIDGCKMSLKKNYQRFHQPITSSKNVEYLIKEGIVDWSNIGRQTLVYNYKNNTKNIKSVFLQKASNTRMIKVKESLKNISIGSKLDVKIPYEISPNEKYIIIRKLATREVALHQEVLSQMKIRNTMDDQNTLEVIDKYQNLIAYIETPVEVKEMLISLQSKFDDSGMAFAGKHNYDQLPKIMKDSEVQIKEFGLIPKEFKCINIRIGYLRIEEASPIKIQLI